MPATRLRHRHRPRGPDGSRRRTAQGRGAALFAVSSRQLRRHTPAFLQARPASSSYHQRQHSRADPGGDLRPGRGLRHHRRRRQRHLLEAVQMLRPGGCIGNVNYLGSGEFVRIPRSEWGCGMNPKTITGGLMPGERLRMEKAGRTAAIQPSGHGSASHRLSGFESLETALLRRGQAERTYQTRRPALTARRNARQPLEAASVQIQK